MVMQHLIYIIKHQPSLFLKQAPWHGQDPLVSVVLPAIRILALVRWMLMLMRPMRTATMTISMTISSPEFVNTP